MTKLISLGQISLLTNGTAQIMVESGQNPIFFSPRKYCHLPTGTVNCINNGMAVCPASVGGCVITP